MKPAPATREDVEPFVDELLSEPVLWQLVDRFLGESLSAHARFLSQLNLPDNQRPQTMAILDSWAKSRRDLPDPPPRGSDPVTRLLWLQRFGASCWDLRLGAERDFVPSGAELFAPSTATLVYELAARWEMVKPRLAQGDFDFILVPGGLLRANVNRPAAAARLLTGGRVRSSDVVGLGGRRPMSTHELELAAAVGCHSATEDEALRFGVARAFGVPDRQWEPTARPDVQQLVTSTGIRLSVAIAPPRPGGSRPNTGSAFDWFIAGAPHLVARGRKMLCVTTSVYWIRSHAALLPHMPDGTELMTFGADPAWAEESIRQVFLSQDLLQEIKSNIDALADLARWSGLLGAS